MHARLATLDVPPTQAVGGKQASFRRAGEEIAADSDVNRSYAPGAMAAALMDDAFELLSSPRSKTMLAPELAAKFDQWFISVHPFHDGNGRVGRLVTDWLLINAGYPPALHTSGAAMYLGKAPDKDDIFARITRGMEASVKVAETAGQLVG